MKGFHRRCAIIYRKLVSQILPTQCTAYRSNIVNEKWQLNYDFIDPNMGWWAISALKSKFSFSMLLLRFIFFLFTFALAISKNFNSTNSKNCVPIPMATVQLMSADFALTHTRTRAQRAMNKQIELIK